MDEASPSGLKTILLEARNLTGAARQAYLDRVCKTDPDLRDEIDSLLQFEAAVPSVMDAGGGILKRLEEGLEHRAAGGPATTPTAALDGDEIAAITDDHAGDSIGPYRLVDVLGEGGMGVVYRAEQVSPIRRDVALKLIRRGLDTDRVVARFDQERQALARMEHPSIARVLDAGASADGRPYFVMELVQGAPITEFCDTERLTLRERVELAIAVCHAVQHAHQKGIIHRDLKPSNILVARQDDVPVPKVIDFGIAKAIEEPLSDHTLLTRAGQFIGTPDYMSPEQAGAMDIDVDTRTDVYALGVLLYELLAGRRPHLFERRSQDEVQEVLRSHEPDRPSTGLSPRRRLTTRHMVTLDEPARARIAENRRTTTDRLRRQLVGDLDNIVLKAMQKEPDRRYGSMEQLADDLQRYLDGKPVLARPDTWTYRTSKFVRRHTVGVGMATAAALTLVGFAVMTSIQSSRVARERDRALAAEQRARIEAETSKQVSDFMVGLFRVSDPNTSRGNTITAREILDRGAQRIGTDLKATPRVQGKLLHTMGAVYKNLGLYDQAADAMTQAIAAREQGAPDELEMSLDELGDIERYRGRFDAAEPILRRALDVRRKQFGNSDPKVGQTLNNLAILLDEQGKYDEAESMHRESLRIRRAALGPKDNAVANSLGNLGIVLRHSAKYAEAEQALREAIAIRRELFGDVHPLVAHNLNTLGSVLGDVGRYSDAEPLLRECLAIRRKVLPKTHPNLANTMSDLASVLQDQMKLDEAEALYLEALGIERAIAPPLPGATGPVKAGSTNLSQVLNNLATLYEDRGDYRRAEPLYVESLEMRRAMRGERHPSVAHALSNLARLRFQIKQLGPAERLAREALALRLDLLGANALGTAQTRAVLGDILRARGALTEAEQQFRAALEFRGPEVSADHPLFVQIQVGLARVLLDRKKPADAEPLLRAALAARSSRFAAADKRVAEVQVDLARALAALGRADEAQALRPQLP